MTFGDMIYNLRWKSKLSQEEFAELFRVSHQAVNKWENNDEAYRAKPQF